MLYSWAAGERQDRKHVERDDVVMKPCPIDIIMNSAACFSETRTTSANPKSDPEENPHSTNFSWGESLAFLKGK